MYRFGWFMSSSVINDSWNSSHAIVDHWRALQLPDVSTLFDLSDEEDMLKYLTRPDLSNSVSYCNELSTDCLDGFYQTQRCRQQHPNNCAVLLSSFPGWHFS